MTSARLLALRAVVGALVVSGAVFGLYQHRHLGVGSGPGAGALALVFFGVQAAIQLGAAALAVALLWRCPQRPDARALAVFLALLSFIGAGDGLYLFRTTHDLPLWLSVGLDTLYPITMVGALAALLRFSVLFPRPLGSVALAGVAILPRLRLRLLDPAWTWRVALAAALGLQLLVAGSEIAGGGAILGVPVYRVIRPLFMATLIGGLVLCVLNLKLGHDRSDREGRRRVHWVVQGVLAGTVVFVLSSAVKLVQMVLGYSAAPFWYFFSLYLAMLILLSFLAVAMLYAGAVDPDLAIRRTALVGLLGVSMVFIFAATEQLVQAYLLGWLGLSDRLGGMLTGGTVALTFEPVKRRVTALLEAVGERLDRRRPVAEIAGGAVSPLARR